VLDGDLIDALVSGFIQPELVTLTVEEFDKELKKENSRKNLDRQKAAESKRPTQKELRAVEVSIQNIIKAISSFGPDFSSTFAAELRQLQSRKNTLEAQLGVSVEPLTLVLPNELRKYVLAKMADLRTLLLGAGQRPSKRSNSTSGSSLLRLCKAPTGGRLTPSTGQFPHFLDQPM
jgi:septal ring factor EnvC (AmiA/AmiB activator)